MTRIKCPKCGQICVEGTDACSRCGTVLPRIRMVVDDPQVAAMAGPQLREATLFRPGQSVANRYTVVDVIGRGGMGCIYRVRDNTLGEEVALKTLLPEFLQNKLVVERFFNEARIARQLSHPNIIRVHDIGMTGSAVYISMELLKGKSLREMLDALLPGERLPVDMTLRVIDELCAALEYAHRYTVHRDIKPENIMVLPDGNIKLMDFGISKLMANTRMTAVSVVMGTPMYMSPEQIKNSRDVDARADLFSAGVVLYEMLTGNVPSGVSKPASHIRRDTPPEMDAIIAKCVEPNREHRYRNVTELRDALLSVRARFTPGIGVAAPLEPPASVSRTVFRKAAGALLIALLAAGACFGVWKQEQHYRTADVQAPPEPLAPAPEDDLQAEFDRIAGLIARAQPDAAKAAQDDELKTKTLGLASDWWTQAQASSAAPSDASVQTAMDALICFAALTLWPEGMVFVPPGKVTVAAGEPQVWTEGFFIDETEVTVGQFLEFCQAYPWWQPLPEWLDLNPDEPVTNVTFYDALAFAASRPGPKTLPTEAQWVRAAQGAKPPPAPALPESEDRYEGLAPVGNFPEDTSDFGCLDMAGNAAEWTLSPFDPINGGRPEDLDFGSDICVRGGNFLAPADAPLTARYAAKFEYAADTIGFRCVRNLPFTLDEIEAALQD